MSALLPVAEALAQVLAAPSASRRDRSAPAGRPGSGAGRRCCLPIAVPGDDNSAMDGYALRAAKRRSPCLSVSAFRPARRHALQPGTAARIFTGAAIPPGRGRGRDAGKLRETRGVVTYPARCRRTEYSPARPGYRAGKRCWPRPGAASAGPGLLASIGARTVNVYRPCAWRCYPPAMSW